MWRDLARVFDRLRLRADLVEAALRNAIGLLPTEARFKQELQQFREQPGSRHRERGDITR